MNAPPRDEVIARLAAGVAAVPADAWDALHDGANPFVSHAFLTLLETSGSVGPGTGWQATPVLIDGPDGVPVAAMPAYLKGHSQGEYVFDHAWARAWEAAGGDYYPKLQIAVPFTPVTGPRLLTGTGGNVGNAGLRATLIAAAEAVVRAHGLSSAHATFLNDADRAAFDAAGWLMRRDVQFHWRNQGYRSFDDFLGTLSSMKRKTLRRERRLAGEAATLRTVRGAAISAADWDAMWSFYQDTGARKWGTPYLTRAAFDGLAALGDAVVLTLADVGGRTVAGALHLVGGDTLYGRYWGTVADAPMLHFELCYYQAIDFAIAEGLARVEAGAQGGHKLARGYGPVATWSAHFIPDAGFRDAVARFLDAERAAMAEETEWLDARTPFRKV